MCICFLRLDPTSRYSTVVGFNRDEFLERDTRGPHWWEREEDEGGGAASVFGGRDLIAGGTWLGVTSTGPTTPPSSPPNVPNDAANLAAASFTSAIESLGSRRIAHRLPGPERRDVRHRRRYVVVDVQYQHQPRAPGHPAHEVLANVFAGDLRRCTSGDVHERGVSAPCVPREPSHRVDESLTRRVVVGDHSGAVVWVEPGVRVEPGREGVARPSRVGSVADEERAPRPVLGAHGMRDRDASVQWEVPGG